MVRLKVETAARAASMRIGFTEQRLIAHGGLAAWSGYVVEIELRDQLRAVLPHALSSPNAHDPTATALGFIGGIMCGADKLARIAHLAHDPALAEVLGIEAVPSQSTFSRFFGACERKACEALAGLAAWSLRDQPGRASSYTLDLDAFALIHVDGRQQGVRVPPRPGAVGTLRQQPAAVAVLLLLWGGHVTVMVVKALVLPRR